MDTRTDIYPIKDSNRIADQLKTTTWQVGVMVSLLQQYYGSPERLIFEKSRFLWNPDDASSELYINNIDNLDYQNMGSRPAIIVDVEDHNFPEESIADRNNYLPIPGIQEFTIRDKSCWTIECWSKLKLEASSLADETRLFLQTYRLPISMKYGFDKIRPSRQIKPVKYQEFSQHWIARLIVDFELQDNFGLETEALKLTGFSLKLKP